MKLIIVFYIHVQAGVHRGFCIACRKLFFVMIDLLTVQSKFSVFGGTESPLRLERDFPLSWSFPFTFRCPFSTLMDSSVRANADARKHKN